MSNALAQLGNSGIFVATCVIVLVAFVALFVWMLRDNSRASAIEKTYGKLSALQKELERLQMEIASRNEELSRNALEYHTAQGLKEAFRRQPELKAELDALNASLAKGRQDYDNYKFEFQNLVKQKEFDLSALDVKLEARKKDLEDLEKTIRDAAPRLNELSALDAQISNRKIRLSSLDGQIGEAQKKVSDVLTTIAKGLERLEKMNLSGVQELRYEAFRSLKEPVFYIGNQTVSGRRDEKTSLETVRKHFKDTGFDIPDRLLAAFHASLKTSAMSSLTVMAGVSGTGKSALPKLYAEAMGISFQPLAVEPRWDSPKDLLGFFNYATNRYEPTPLARALFQFQHIRPQSFLPDVDMADYMLMPMLDEMNLARIEYYFSEFLSKLELRRGEEVAEENYHAVSLEVFPRWKGKDRFGHDIVEEAIRLFADTNTLFVGTMNEDETTQSLSDKVIDRANVLYFGRPNRLRSTTKQAGNGARSCLLRKSEWQSWLSGVVPGQFEDAERTLAQLNAELAKLGRPFAHRTYQAMLSYLANYYNPDLNETERVIRALSDQIGMRIMPKLRGLDLTQNAESLDAVGKIVARLGDAALTSAFRNASNREQNRTGFFAWGGFDWHEAEV